MYSFIYLIIAVILGFAMGILLTYLFKVLPEKWLQDYDYDPKAENFRPAKRMKIVPHGLWAGLFCALFYAVALWFAPEMISDMYILRLLAILFVVPVLFLVLISDKLNRIIPDEFWIFILLCGFLLLASDYVERAYFFSEDAKWYLPLINRLGAAIGGALVLFLIGFI